MSTYFRSLAEYYRLAGPEQIGKNAIHQAKRCMLDSIGCMLASADGYAKELQFIASLGGSGECRVPGTELKLPAAQAAFAANMLASAEEMDDATAVGASVHPGCCVIPAALAAGEKNNSSNELLLRSIVFGYDLCNRLGLMATEKIRELGLYGPGLLAAPCAAAVSGLLAGLDAEQLENAFSIALSMSPVCPFSSFTDGADVKLLYTGWGVYLGMLAAEMAAEGFTGPEHILRGGRSLESFFASDKGCDIPAGDMRYATAVVFKDYAACLSTHAVLTATEKLMQNGRLDPEKIAKVEIGTYPYACELDRLTGEINRVSARTSLAFCVSTMLCTDRVDPQNFTEQGLTDEHVLGLMEKVSVRCIEEYGSGPFGIRGGRVRIRMNDGSVHADEVKAAKWNPCEPPSDRELVEKFFRITEGKLDNQRREAIAAAILSMEPAGKVTDLSVLL